MFKSRRSRLFEQTALPYLTDVYRVARQMSDDQHADDLVQETYLRAWKYFESFTQGTNARAWLMRILHNVWSDRWHQPRLEIPLSDCEETTLEPYYSWETQFLSDELPDDIEKALGQLPDAYRWAILLADVEELSYQEIATVMDCPIGTVMSRINRSRRTLAPILRFRSTGSATCASCSGARAPASPR